ncbi:exodeoxyribonuclease V subunit beta [Buchnera aphidicola (Aphis craccivora)]|uniref:RecBCD enzyme subunit RecB n=1 Tax=Buchnera aphidicola (Aphis craccivora) TaxID=466616 RepID=A0A4D6XJV9_9GAMM|nr:exodeoxyribonuclease V subunit beta [Buchnera aphidicola]QCI16683.1 exodeoxyribonuclease V subunit beta [Buchnera aphidicola (Aphis craccivora)]QLL40815.1 exodeoxyribonuclease V subunit beta [Buchnera aphidicola (Aphis craccivore)]WAI17657.1 MAG: exodeoxyribonuclease V subunit beta [Buchnera aphidicola (Aphis craccivora)]
MKKKLNIFEIPFNGVNLIEASAGTGKTTAIVLMYLRLLLGIDNKKNIKPLLIQEILIVTFTNFAKDEIHKRIKKNIEKLHLYCITQNTNNSILKPFLEKIKNLEEAIYILERAKQNINYIAIYTIHGFCKDILQLNFYNINEKIIENEELLYLQATEDFWRSYFYQLPKNIINIISKDYKNPEALLSELKPIFNFNTINFNKKFTKNQNPITCHEDNIKIINTFKKKWLDFNLIILDIIRKSKPNKKIYNERNISRWRKNITTWAESTTENYQIPIELKYFSQATITKNIKSNYIPCHIFFKDIEEILKKKFSLKNIILFQAIKKISKLVKKEKNKKFLLGFNDLLNNLLKYIKKDKKLKQLIIKKYPVAFIDEFQDTDIQQYEIFNILYNINNEKTALFLIGDPKQSIYSFRGADIFSYLHAKSKIKQYYYLDTNWRSSKNICEATNDLFSRNKKPFFFKNIPFEKISPSFENQNMQFKIQGKIQNAISLFFKKKEKIYIEDYQEWIAKQCANEIYYWLICAKKGQATLINKDEKKILKESDIVILVKNKNEANIIKNSLEKVNIKSIYSSSSTSVFKTSDACELLVILKTILQPTNIKLLKQSIFTHIFYEILLKSEKQKNTDKSYFIIKKLYKYRNIWKNTGIFYTIKTIILDYQKYSNNLDKYKYSQKNINFLHIAELLEEQSENFHQESSLIRWFEKKILEKQNILENENIRHFKQSNEIQIITIHKSKGLEYPIVWIPFAATYKKSKLHLYHDKKKLKIFFDLDQSKATEKIAEEERLAEDLRLLYVAITRAVYHCSLGMGDIINKKNQKKSNNYKSALGYIIQRGCHMDYNSLLYEVNTLNVKSYITIKHDTVNIKISSIKEDVYFLSQPKYLINKIQNYLQTTSFTKLKKENISINQNNCNINYTFNHHNIHQEKIIFENFPIGEKTGILIHYILNKINFSEKLNIDFFYKSLKEHGFSEKWAPVLISWINKIIHINLKNLNFNLSMLKSNQYIKEMKFFLPIQKALYSIDFNHIVKSFDPISSLSPKISFNPVTGILKGSIDLVFFWKKKYYIIDYKSNYLGNCKNSYSLKNIKKEIIKNRYDLQYQIYTVALHQYLNKKVKKYEYKNNFGGIFYMFLRGIDKTDKNNGIFYIMPNYLLVKNLINLFLVNN